MSQLDLSAEFISDLIGESLCLIGYEKRQLNDLPNGQDPVKTGFFISPEGHVLTCLHGKHHKQIFAVHWRGKTYEARRSQPWSAKEEELKGSDLLVLKIANGRGLPPFPFVPLLNMTGRFLDNEQRSVATFGYADALQIKNQLLGAGKADLDESLVVRWPFFNGKTVKELKPRGNRPDPTYAYTKIAVQNIQTRPGHSGAPLLDVRELMVVGIVTNQEDDWLYAHTLNPIFTLLPEIERQFTPVGIADWDDRCLSFFSERGHAIPESLLNGRRIHKVVQRWNRAVLDRLRSELRFLEELYLPPPEKQKVLHFLGRSAGPRVMFLVGLSGMGKTNLLAHLTQVLIDNDAYPPLLMPGEKLRGDTLSNVIPACLKLAISLPNMLAELNMAGQRPVLFLDALNDWRDFRSDHFSVFLEDLAILANRADFRVVCAFREEFFQSHFPNLFFRTSEMGAVELEKLPANFLYRDLNHQAELIPFLQMGQPDGGVQGEKKIKTMYEAYRKAGEIQVNGRSIGFSPKTTYRQLSLSARHALSRPVVLAHIMRVFHNRRIPEYISGYKFLGFFWGGISDKQERSKAMQSLMDLTRTMLDRQLGPRLPLSPHKQSRDTLDLLTKTPLLHLDLDEKGEKALRFSHPWYFEVCLARLFLNDLLTGDISDNPESEVLAKLEGFIAGFNAPAMRQFLIGTLVQLSEWITEDHPDFFFLIIRLFKDSQERSVYFARGLLNRIQSGFFEEKLSYLAESFFAGLINHKTELNPLGLSNIAAYLENLDETGKFAALHIFSQKMEPFWRDCPIKAVATRAVLAHCIALFYLRKRDVLKTYFPILEEQRLDKAGWEKLCFIRGKVEQFYNNHEVAAEWYRKGLHHGSKYHYHCRHQLIFMNMMDDSNFKSCAQDLQENMTELVEHLGTSHVSLTSRLLYLTCQVRAGNYQQTGSAIEEVALAFHDGENNHGEGKARRLLADFLLCTFASAQAAREIDLSLEVLGREHLVSRAYALDIKAQIEGLLFGRYDEAFASLEEALAIVRQKDHRRSVSWSLQTRALLNAQAGNQARAYKDLESSRQLGLSAYQRFREAFTLLLAQQAVGPGSADRDLAAALPREARTRGFGFFPDLLAIMVNPDKADLALTPGVCREGLKASALYAVCARH